MEECRKRGIAEVKAAAADSLQRVNKIYQLSGLQIRARVVNHGIITNIYVIPTGLLSASPPAHQEPKGP